MIIIKYNSILILVGVMLLLIGCQSTPDEDIVVNKNETKQVQNISDDASGTDSQSTKTDIPDTYKDSFKCLNDDVTVTVDAGVSVLGDNRNFSTIRVKPHDITEDDVKKWGEVFFEGQTAYEPKAQYTKAELEEKILMLKKLNNPDTLLEVYGSEEAVEIMQAAYDKDIAYYESIYNSTPDEIDKRECDWQFHPLDYYDIDAGLWEGNDEYKSLKKSEEIAAVCVTEEGYEKYLMSTRRKENDYRVNTILYAVRSDDTILQKESDKELSKEETANMASDLIKKLGLEEWTENDSYTVRDEDGLLYAFSYSLNYDGKPIFFDYIDAESEDSYAAIYDYPSLNVTVLNGVVSNVMLISPLEAVETLEENVETLPFEEIYDRFKSQMENQYTISSFIEFGDADAEVSHTAEIKITSIKQGLFRVSEKNKDYSYILTPVWRFTGEIFVDDSSWGESNVCYVNAIDGSIIDPKLGY